MHFCLGPGGINILLDCLEELYVQFRQSPLLLQKLFRQHQAVYDDLHELPSELLRLVQLFSSKYPRSVWDPKDGFSEFWEFLNKHRKEIPVSHRHCILWTFLTFLLGWHCRFNFLSYDFCYRPTDAGFPTVQQKLKDIFKSTSYSAQVMPNSVICSGEFGLDGLYSRHIHHLLDWMDIDHLQYAEFYQVFSTLCRGLTEKLREFVTGRSNSSFTTSASSAIPSSSSVPTSKSTNIIEVEAFVRRIAAHSWEKFVETLLCGYPLPFKPLLIQTLRAQDMDSFRQHRKITLVSHLFLGCIVNVHDHVLPSFTILIAAQYMAASGQQLLIF